MPKTPNTFAFIPIPKQDPDSDFLFSQKDEKRATYRGFLAFSPFRSGRAVFGIIAFFITILFPFSFANAGILSFMGDMLADLHFSSELLMPLANSQTMPLLEAVRNSDPSPDPDGRDVTIVNDSAILAASTPNQFAGNIPVPASDQISVYVVRKGDTLSAIAQMFNVSANTIRWSNDIPRGDGVKVGQKLVILPVSGIQYAIKKGDTVAKIAALYKADADELRSFNGMEEGEKLAVGDTIIIPNGVELESPPTITPKKGNRGYVPDNFSFVATDGYFVRPTAGRKTQGLHGNCRCGVDFHADKGTAVVAAAAGTVVVSRSSGWNGGYGQYIVIKHTNGTQTLYAHLSNNVATEGQNVYQGQIIAYSGATGKSFGPHLHFEVRGGRNPF